MLIVEGPDGAGKTTLCKQLSTDLGLPIMDWGIDRDDLKEDPARRYYRAIRLAYDSKEVPRIHDRLYFSSLVYGPVMQGNIQMTVEDKKLISRTILALACPIILCMPPKGVVMANVRGEGHQMEGVAAVIEDIYDGYLEVFKNDLWPFILWYDYTGTDSRANVYPYHEIKRRVQHYLDHRLERTT